MIKLLTTVALVAVVASPALAKDRATHRARAEAAQAQQQAQDQQQRRATNPSNNVYDIHGQYVGSDPDPTIRAQMANDPSQSD
jgi:Ni/Co efflux regulator RcnB